MHPDQARKNPGSGGSFCWQSVYILSHIREIGEGWVRVKTSSALVTYVALTELASNARSPIFRAAISEIAKRADMSVRTVSDCVRLLEAGGFVGVTHNFYGDGNLQGSSTYTLTQHDPAHCKFCRALGESKRPVKLPTSEGESEKEEVKSALLSPPDFSDWLCRAKEEFPNRQDLAAILEKFITHYARSPSMMSYARLSDWVRNEKSPRLAQNKPKELIEPPGWKEFVITEFPIAEYPTRDRWEEKEWAKIPAYHRTWLEEHPLAEAVLAQAKARALPVAEVAFSYGDHDGIISALEPLVGRSGWLAVSQITVESLDQAEDHLIVAAICDDGTALDEPAAARLLTLPGRTLATVSADPIITELDALTNQRRAAIQRSVSERNAGWVEAEAAKLEAWSDDLKLGLEREIKELDRLVKEARREATIALTLEAKLAAQKRIRSLESTRNDKRRTLFEAQDQVDRQRDDLIASIEGKLTQGIGNQSLFSLRWTLSA